MQAGSIITPNDKFDPTCPSGHQFEPAPPIKGKPYTAKKVYAFGKFTALEVAEVKIIGLKDLVFNAEHWDELVPPINAQEMVEAKPQVQVLG